MNEQIESNKIAKLIKTWLKLSRNAASGGNQQLWEASITGQNKGNLWLELRLKKPKEVSYADAFGSGALMSLGCLEFTTIEVGKHFDFINTQSEIYSNKNIWETKINLNFEFQQNPKKWIPLDTILNRRTYRGTYKKSELNSSLTDKINVKFGKYPHLKKVDKIHIIPFLEESTLIRLIEKKLYFELLDEIYERESESHRQTGLPMDTLGLNFISKNILGFLRRKNIHPSKEIFHWLSVKETISQPIINSHGLYHLSSGNDSPEQWIQLGRQFQKLWLEVEEMGLGMQPFANNLIVYNYLKDPRIFDFKEKSINRIYKWYKTLSESHSIDMLKPGIFFRVGHPKSQTLASPRKPIISPEQDNCIDSIHL